MVPVARKVKDWVLCSSSLQQKDVRCFFAWAVLVGILFFEFLVIHWQLLFLGKWLGSKDVVVELSLCNKVSVTGENHKSSPNLDKDFSVF